MIPNRANTIARHLPELAIACALVLGLSHRGGVTLLAHYGWLFASVFALVLILASHRPNLGNGALLASRLAAVGLAVWTLAILWLNPFHAFGSYEFLALQAGAMTFLALTYLGRRYTRVYFFWLLAFAGTFSSILSSWLYLTHTPTRAFGPFANLSQMAVTFPNAFGLFLLICLPPTLLLLLSSRTRWAKGFLWCSLVLQSTSLCLTFSRESWVALIGVSIVVVYFLARRTPNRTNLISPLGFLFLATIASVFLASALTSIRSVRFPSENLVSKVTFSSEEKRISVTDRIGLWKLGSQTALSHPLVGFGLGQFNAVAQNHEHNLLLSLANNLGLPGLALFLTLLISTFSIIRKRSLASSTPFDPTDLALCAIILLILAQSMVDINLNFTANAIPFWSSLGLLASPTTHPTNNRGGQLVSIPMILLALAVASLSGRELHLKTKLEQAKTPFQRHDFDQSLQDFANSKRMLFPAERSAYIAKSYLSLAKDQPASRWRGLGLKALSKLKPPEMTFDTRATEAELCLIAPSDGCAGRLIPDLLGDLDLSEQFRGPWKSLRLRSVLLDTLVASRSERLPPFASASEKVVRRYLPVLQRNEQFAVLTDNPDYALKIYSTLISISRLGSRFLPSADKLESDRYALAETLKTEKEKMSNLGVAFN